MYLFIEFHSYPGAAMSISWAENTKINTDMAAMNRATTVETLSTTFAPWALVLLLRAEAIAEWNGPFMPPSRDKKKVGNRDEKENASATGPTPKAAAMTAWDKKAKILKRWTKMMASSGSHFCQRSNWY